MNSLSTAERLRLLDLLADEQFDQLDLAEQAELESLRAKAAAAGAQDERDIRGITEDLIGMLHGADVPHEAPPKLPSDIRQRLIERGERLVAHADAGASMPLRQDEPRRARSGWWPLLSIAAIIVVAGAAVGVSVVNMRDRDRLLKESQDRVAMLEAKISDNQAVLASAQSEVDRLTQSLAANDSTIDEQERRIAEAAQRELDLARQLADATDRLDDAELTIARYETPVDPATLTQNRTKLLDVPGTVRLAWSPFNLPDSKAEQQDVTGDVVWNDELQTGYLRFVGLDVNDPNIEQYQVWVIDERGMEQKVSGGVFNATAQGEVIVPIHPGIDVGRVALFAITIEEPGGTWVPDLRRRVVVAPRDGS